MFSTRIVVSERALEENDERSTPCDSRYDFVSWMMCLGKSQFDGSIIAVLRVENFGFVDVHTIGY